MQFIDLSLIIIFSFVSCVNNPKVKQNIKQDTKQYAKIGNEIFLGFNYGISKNYYLSHLDDLVRENVVLFDKSKNSYYYLFVCGIGTSDHAYNDTIRGTLEPQFDSEFGLFKLSIDLLDYKTEEVKNYFQKLYSEKYGECQHDLEIFYGTRINYDVWKNNSKSISLRHYTVTRKYKEWDGDHSKDEVILGPIIYLNDSIEQIINIRDKSMEERKNNELINKSKNSNSEKI